MIFRRKPSMALLVLGLIICSQVYPVEAVSECTPAILASVFGTLGAILLIAAIAALIWYCCTHRKQGSSGELSVDTASEPEVEDRAKAKRDGMSLGVNGEPVTFSHHYSEKAPSAAYNTSGVLNPAFSAGNQEVSVDMPSARKGDAVLDMDGVPSLKADYPAVNKSGVVNPAFAGNQDVHIDMPSAHKEDVVIDMDGNPSLNANYPGGDLRGPGFPHGNLQGLDADVTVKDPPKPKLDLSGFGDLPTMDVALDRPETGGLGLLIARDKNLPPPALFIRDVTPGGVAAKTGLIDQGDKIIGIDGTPIEGMSHDKVMGLLRDSKGPQMHLKLLKCGSKIGMEPPCEISMENEVDAALPTADFDSDVGISGPSFRNGMEMKPMKGNFDVEGLQGNAARPGVRGDIGDLQMATPKGNLDLDTNGPDLGVSGRSPRFELDTNRPKGDIPGGKFQTRLSGPDVDPDVDINTPSGELNLPSAKTKRGKCFSCMSSKDKDKDEPYRRTNGNANLNFNRPDVDGSMDMERGGKFGADVSGPGVDRFGGKGTDAGLRASGPDVEFPKHKGNVNADVDIPQPDLSVQSKNKRGKFSGPSIEGGDFDLDNDGSGLGVSTRAPRAGWDANPPDVKTQGGKLRTDLSGPDVNLSTDRRTLPQGNVAVPEAELDLPSAKKKKSGNCFSCASSPDKDEPYGKAGAKGNGGFDFDTPGGSMEMKEVGKFGVDRPDLDVQGFERPEIQRDVELHASRPEVDFPKGDLDGDVDISGPNVSMPSTHRGGKFSMPPVDGGDVDFDASGPNVDMSARKPRGGLDIDSPDIKAPKGNFGAKIAGPEVDLPEAKFRDPKANFNASGPDVDISTRKPRGGVDIDSPDIKAPKGKFGAQLSGPDADLPEAKFRDPKANINTPSAEMNLPSSKKKSKNCLSCTPKGDKEEPYGKTKGSGGFDFNGPDVDGGFGGKQGGNFDIHGDAPDVDGFKVRGMDKDFGVRATGPDVDFPEKDLDKDINISGPNVSMPSGNGRGKFSMPSTNGEDVDFDANGQNVDFSTRKPRVGLDDGSPDIRAPKGEFEMSGAGPDFDGLKGRGKKKGVTFGATGPDVDIPKGDLDGDLDISGPDVSMPSTHRGGKFSMPSVGGGDVDFDASGPNVDMSTRKPRGGLDINSPDFKAPKGNFGAKVDGPEADLPEAKFRDPKAKMNTPSAEMNLPSSKKKRTNCLSCTPKGDKEEPYGKTKGSGGFDFNGPDVDGGFGGKQGGNFDMRGDAPDVDGFKVRGMDKDFGVRASGPDVNIPKGDLDKDINISGPNGFMSSGNGRGKFSMPSTNGGNLDYDASGPDVDLSTRKPRVGLDSDSLDINGPKGKFDMGGSSPDFDGFKGRGIKKDLGFHATGPDVDIPKVDLDKNMDVSGPNVSMPSARGGGKFSMPSVNGGDVDFDASGPDVDLSTRKPRFGLDTDSLDIDGPKGNYGMSGPDVDIPNVDLDKNMEVSGPNVSMPSAHGGGKFSMPSANGGDVDFDASGPDVDLSTRKPRYGLDTDSLDIDGPKGKYGMSGPDVDIPNVDLDKNMDVSGPDVSMPSTHGGGKFSMPSANGGDVDFDARGPNGDISSRKPRFGLDTDSLDIDGPKGKFGLSGSGPDVDGFNGKGINKDLGFHATGPDVDISEGDLDTNFGLSGPNVSMPSARGGGKFSMPSVNGGDLDFDANGPNVDVSTRKPRFGLDTDSLDASGNTPGESGFSITGRDVDFDGDAPELPKANGKGSIFGWGGQTSTPKAEVSGKQVNLLPNVESEICVENVYDNAELASAPDMTMNGSGAFPSVEYEKPRDLQRYDEIRPDMELKLFHSPEATSRPKGNFTFNSVDDIPDVPKKLERQVTLVKVEENVSVYSASLAEDKPIPKNRMSLVLDRQVHRTLEVVIPGEEDAVKPDDTEKPSTTRKSSSSTSSSSSSDDEKDKKKKTKRKRKFHLPTFGRKSSTSSESSDEDKKKPETKRKSSKSSNSSDDHPEAVVTQKSDNTVDISHKIEPVALIRQTKEETSSSSSDEAPSVIQQEPVLLRKKSKSSSSSSSEDEASKDKKTARGNEPEMIFRSAEPIDPDFSVKPTFDIKTLEVTLEQQIDQRERKSSTSSSSSSDENVAATSYTLVHEDEPEAVSRSVKPTDPDFSFTTTYVSPSATVEPVKTPDWSIEHQIEPRERKSSSSSSSSDEEIAKDKELPETTDGTRSTIDYHVDFTRYRQEYTISSIREEQDEPNPTLTVNEDAPEMISRQIHPTDPEYSVTLTDVRIEQHIEQRERKDSTSSSSSSDKDVASDNEAPETTPEESGDLQSTTVTWEQVIQPQERKRSTSSSSSDEGVQVHQFETVYHVMTPDVPATIQDPHSSEIREHPPVVMSRSIKRTTPDVSFVTDDIPSHQDQEEHLFSSATHHQIEYPYNVERGREDGDDGREHVIDTIPVVVSRTVESEIPTIADEEEDGETGRLSPAWDVQVHQFETVYHVTTPDVPDTIQDPHSSEIREHSPVVVSRSIKRTTPDVSFVADDIPTHQDQEEQFGFSSVTHHQIEYPYNVERGREDGDEGREHVIDTIPVVVSRTVESEIPTIDTDEEDELDDLLPREIDGRASPVWDVQVHKFETVYHVMEQEYPSDGEEKNGSEVRERSPIVVSRSIKRTTPDVLEDDKVSGEPLLLSSVTEVEFSEPSMDYQIEYPEGDKANISGGLDALHSEEEWIAPVSRSKQDTDISLLRASFDEDTSPTRTEGRSPRGTSPGTPTSGEIKRRGSNSRLWDLMQGYLIEETIIDDKAPSATESAPPKENAQEPSQENPDKYEVEEHQVDVFESGPQTWNKGAISPQDPKPEAVNLTIQSREFSIPEDKSSVDKKPLQSWKTQVTETHEYKVEEHRVESVPQTWNNASESLQDPKPEAVNITIQSRDFHISEHTSSVAEKPLQSWKTQVTAPDIYKVEKHRVDVQESEPQTWNNASTSSQDPKPEAVNVTLQSREFHISEGKSSADEKPVQSWKTQVTAPYQYKVEEHRVDVVESAPQTWNNVSVSPKDPEAVNAVIQPQEFYISEDKPSVTERRLPSWNKQFTTQDKQKEEERRVFKSATTTKGNVSIGSQRQKPETVSLTIQPKDARVSGDKAVANKETVPSWKRQLTAGEERQVSVPKTRGNVSFSSRRAESGAMNVTIQPRDVHVLEDRSVGREKALPSWRRQVTANAELEDIDKPEDPWVKHYSRGLERGFSYQPPSGRSPESATSFNQSRSLSLSKVPHVRGLRTTPPERERDRPRYFIENKTRSEPAAYRSGSDRRSVIRELEGVPKMKTHETMLALRDVPDEKSTESKTSSVRPAASSDVRQVRDLRSLWEKEGSAPKTYSSRDR